MPIVRRSNKGKRVTRRKKLRVKADLDQLCARVTISTLPDDVLLEIFDCVALPQEDHEIGKGPTVYEDRWHTLVHVCRRWRCIVLDSPLRLALQIVCTNKRPVKKMLHIWPPFPIYVWAHRDSRTLTLPGVNNIITALKEHDRVFGILIDGVSDSLLKRPVMMKSFPALEQAGLLSYHEQAPVLSDSFFGGSAPCLQSLWLEGISFPGLGKLLSTTDLVNLYLTDIHHSGYISPEAMVAILSTLTRLSQLTLKFRSPRPQAEEENPHPSPLTRVVLPALTSLRYQGDSEYLEDLMSRIDAPLLESMDIAFFSQLVFDTPQLRHFITRVEQFKAPDRAIILFTDDDVTIDLFQGRLLNISCKTPDRQIPSLAQLYDSAFSPPPVLKALEIHHYRMYWQDNIQDIQWLELLRLFASVEDLVLSAASFQLVASTLDELADEMVTEVLPALQNIFLEDPPPLETVSQTIGKFVAKRRLLDCSVTVYHRDSECQDYVCLEIGDR